MSVTGVGGRPRYEDARPPVIEVDSSIRDTEWGQLVRCLKTTFLWDSYKDTARCLFDAGVCARDAFWLIYVNEDQGLDDSSIRDIAAYRFAILRAQWSRSNTHLMRDDDLMDESKYAILAAMAGRWST